MGYCCRSPGPCVSRVTFEPSAVPRFLVIRLFLHEVVGIHALQVVNGDAVTPTPLPEHELRQFAPVAARSERRSCRHNRKPCAERGDADEDTLPRTLTLQGPRISSFLSVVTTTLDNAVLRRHISQDRECQASVCTASARNCSTVSRMHSRSLAGGISRWASTHDTRRSSPNSSRPCSALPKHHR